MLFLNLSDVFLHVLYQFINLFQHFKFLDSVYLIYDQV